MNGATKSLSELLGLPVMAEINGVSSTVAQRHRLLAVPIAELSPDEVWQLLKTGVGDVFLVEPAIIHLDKDPSLFGLLTGLLRVRAFDWTERPDLVRRLRAIIARALSDLSEWDGTSEIAVDAMRQQIPILEAWVRFEQALSKVP